MKSQNFPLPPELFVQIIEIMRTSVDSETQDNYFQGWPIFRSLLTLRLVCYNIVLQQMLYKFDTRLTYRSPISGLHDYLAAKLDDREKGTRRSDFVCHATFRWSRHESGGDVETETNVFESLKKLHNLRSLRIDPMYHNQFGLIVPNTIMVPGFKRLSKVHLLGAAWMKTGWNRNSKNGMQPFFMTIPTITALRLGDACFVNKLAWQPAMYKLKTLSLERCIFLKSAFQNIIHASRDTLEDLELTRTIIYDMHDGALSEMVYPFAANLRRLRLAVPYPGQEIEELSMPFPLLQTLEIQCSYSIDSSARKTSNIFKIISLLSALRTLKLKTKSYSTRIIDFCSGLENLEINGNAYWEKDQQLYFDASRETLRCIRFFWSGDFDMPFTGMYPMVQSVELPTYSRNKFYKNKHDTLYNLSLWFPALQQLTIPSTAADFAIIQGCLSLPTLEVL